MQLHVTRATYMLNVHMYTDKVYRKFLVYGSDGFEAVGWLKTVWMALKRSRSCELVHNIVVETAMSDCNHLTSVSTSWRKASCNSSSTTGMLNKSANESKTRQQLIYD